MRVIYCFFSEKDATKSGTHPGWQDRQTNHPLMGRHMVSEGRHLMWRRLTELGIVDEVLIVTTAYRETGWKTYTPRMKGLVVPSVHDLEPMLREDDILYVRGGFKPWFPWLQEKRDEWHWLLFYEANTGRRRWTGWDVILDDLRADRHLDGKHGRMTIPWAKPVNQQIFRPLGLPMKYDLCIGASHVHDRKAQWKVVKALADMRRTTGRGYKCVLPGAFKKGTETNLIRHTVERLGLDIELAGNLQREDVARVLNQSRLYVSIGGHGQNDRGPLEALACGTPVLLSEAKKHPPWFHFNDEVCMFVNDPDDPEEMRAALHWAFHRPKFEPIRTDGTEPVPIRRERNEFLEDTRPFVYKTFKRYNGLSKVVVPQMEKLFNFLRKHPKRTPEASQALWNEYGVTA